MGPLISIIVPIYNAEKHISRCVKSILQQTYLNIELILVNDGSTDNSYNICENFKNSDSRVKIINKKNGGVSSARNCGMDIANGEFIGFVDSDDYVDKNMYSKLYSCIDDNTDLAALISNTINKSELLTKDTETLSSYDALGYLFKLEFPTSLWAYLYRREIIGEIRLNEDVHFFEDFEFNTKILMKSNLVRLCKDPLYKYEINEDSINSQTINDKKITCLNIYNRLLKESNISDDIILRSKAEYFRAHFVISIILSLSKSLNCAEKKYFRIAQENAKVVLKDSIQSKYVPIRFIITLIFTALAPTITTKGIHLLRNKRE